MVRCLAIIVAIFCAFAVAAAQTPKYNGPPPPKSDLPYLKHAETLVPTEAVEVKSEKDKDDTRYTIAGASSSARTPLPLPIFIMKAAGVDPLHLKLVRLRSAEGRREITSTEMKNADVLHVSVTRLDSGLYRLDVADSLDSGEYMLVAPAFDRAFCFAVD